jgi:hypothetical protein
LRVTVDLHDIHLEHKGGHFTGAFDFSVPNPSGKAEVSTGALNVDVPDERLAEALAGGFVVQVTGAAPESGEIRVVVRDRSTRITGSLRIPAKAPAAMQPVPRGLGGLLDLTAPDARRADPNAPARAVDHRMNALQIHVPAPLGHIVSMADPIAELRTAPTNVAHLGHRSKV